MQPNLVGLLSKKLPSALPSIEDGHHIHSPLLPPSMKMAAGTKIEISSIMLYYFILG